MAYFYKDNNESNHEKNSTCNSPALLVEGMSLIWADWLQERDLGRLVQHPLLQALTRNEASLNTLKTLLIQHSHYWQYFTRYLCGLMGQLDNANDVLALMENLREEMGVNDGSSTTHAEIFQRTLRVLDLVPAVHAVLPQTQDMIDTMMAHCKSPDALTGLAAMCLGAEAIVPLIYRPILHALQYFGYGEDATEFFSLHIEEDEDHALTMLTIMNQLTQEQPMRRDLAANVGRELIERRIAMFDAIWLQSQTEPSPIPELRAETQISSADFWRVSNRLQVHLPARLNHSQVMETRTGNTPFLLPASPF